MSAEVRTWLVGQLLFSNPESQVADLLDEKKTNTDLIAMLQSLCINGYGHRLYITSLNSDHQPDLCYGEHGHTGGYAADLWLLNKPVFNQHELPSDLSGLFVEGPGAEMGALIHQCAYACKWVTKIGLGGSTRGFLPESGEEMGDTLVFPDNDEDHIHLQTQ